MKAILIKGLEMPDQDSFIDLRIENGKAAVVGCMGACKKFKAEEIEIPDEEKK